MSTSTASKITAVDTLIDAGYRWNEALAVTEDAATRRNADRWLPLGDSTIRFITSTRNWEINTPRTAGLPPDPGMELGGMTPSQAAVALRRLGYPAPGMILFTARDEGRYLTDRHLIAFHGHGDEGSYDIAPVRRDIPEGRPARDQDAASPADGCGGSCPCHGLSMSGICGTCCDGAGLRIRALLYPLHTHPDDGTVEGCPGCFPPGEAIGPAPGHAGWYRPPSGDDPGQMYAPGASTAEDDACARLMLIHDLDLTRDEAAHAVLAARARGGSHQWPDGSVLTPRPGGTWELRRPQDQVPGPEVPDLTREHDVSEILAAIRVTDAHLDANTAQAYRDQPLAGHWSRIGKAQSEANEAMEALAGVTGENPRKGVCDTWEHVCEELGDTACAGLLGIQHVTKDTDVTWAVFIAALSKALRRVPGPGPAPSTTTEGDQ